MSLFILRAVGFFPDVEWHRWLYGMFVAIDANFRLKRKAVSKDSIDPSLSRGWAYFVEENTYKEYLQDTLFVPQEVRYCCLRSCHVFQLTSCSIEINLLEPQCG